MCSLLNPGSYPMKKTITAINDMVNHGNLAITAAVELDHVLLRLEKLPETDAQAIKSLASVRDVLVCLQSEYNISPKE